MQKKNIYSVFCCLIILMGCERYGETYEFFFRLESDVVSRPDSVLRVLDSVKQAMQMDELASARWNLLYIRATDEKTYTLPSDSFMKETDYLYSYGFPREQAYYYHYKGRYEQLKQQNNAAMSHYLLALEKAKSTDQWYIAGLTESYMADLYLVENAYDNAIAILKKTQEHFAKAGSERGEIFALRDIGKVFVYDKQLDSALYYTNMAVERALKRGESDVLSRVYQQLGVIYELSENYDLSESYLQKVISIVTDDKVKARAFFSLAVLAYKFEYYDNAYDYLLQTINLVSDNTYLLRDTYQTLYLLESERGNYKKAIDWNEHFVLLDDSIQTAKVNNRVMQVEERYVQEKLQNENGRLKIINQRKWIFITVLLLILVLSYAIYQRRIINRNRQILSQQAEISDMKEKEAFLREEALSNAVISQKIKLLGDVNPRNEKSIQSILKSFFESTDITDDDWNELEEAINKVHTGFTGKIRKRFPRLTDEEVRVLCLIRIGADTGQLSTLLKIQVDSVMKKRYRIRLKIQPGGGVPLEKFLREL